MNEKQVKARPQTAGTMRSSSKKNQIFQNNSHHKHSATKKQVVKAQIQQRGYRDIAVNPEDSSEYDLAECVLQGRVPAFGLKQLIRTPDGSQNDQDFEQPSSYLSPQQKSNGFKLHFKNAQERANQDKSMNYIFQQFTLGKPLKRRVKPLENNETTMQQQQFDVPKRHATALSRQTNGLENRAVSTAQIDRIGSSTQVRMLSSTTPAKQIRNNSSFHNDFEIDTEEDRRFKAQNAWAVYKESEKRSSLNSKRKLLFNTRGRQNTIDKQLPREKSKDKKPFYRACCNPDLSSPQKQVKNIDTKLRSSSNLKSMYSPIATAASLERPLLPQPTYGSTQKQFIQNSPRSVFSKKKKSLDLLVSSQLQIDKPASIQLQQTSTAAMTATLVNLQTPRNQQHSPRGQINFYNAHSNQNSMKSNLEKRFKRSTFQLNEFAGQLQREQSSLLSYKQKTSRDFSSAKNDIVGETSRGQQDQLSTDAFQETLKERSSRIRPRLFASSQKYAARLFTETEENKIQMLLSESQQFIMKEDNDDENPFKDMVITRK